MELRYKHLIRLTTLRVHPTPPDRTARMVSLFLNAQGWQDPVTNEYLIHPDGNPLTWAEITARDQALADAIAGGPGGVAPAASHVYGNNAASRRIAHGDYTSDQKALRSVYSKHEETVTAYFEVLGSHCTSVGHEVYRHCLPTENHPGDTPLAWAVINERMGIDANHSLQPLLQQF